MSTYPRIYEEEFEADYIAYRDDDGKNVIYDTGAQVDLNTEEKVREFARVPGISRLKKHNYNEVVNITKEHISFGDALPDTTGRRVYEMPCQPMPEILNQLQPLMAGLGPLVKMLGRENVANKLDMARRVFNIPDFTPEQFESLIDMAGQANFNNFFPIVQINVNGIKQNMLFDTGAACHFTCNPSLLGTPNSKRHEWLPMENKYDDLDTFSADFKHECGLQFHTEKLASLVGHQAYTSTLKMLGCQGVLGLEQLDQYDICINKNISVFFIQR